MSMKFQLLQSENKFIEVRVMDGITFISRVMAVMAEDIFRHMYIACNNTNQHSRISVKLQWICGVRGAICFTLHTHWTWK